MTNADIREAHKLLDYVSQGRAVLDDEIKLLRSFLPELPKRKTLEEITEHVYDAWTRTNCNEWAGNIDNPDILLEEWLVELHVQLQGLQDTPAAEPENVAATVHSLPAGMRLADHEQYGRVVTSPKPNRDGIYDLLVPKPKFETGADWEYAHECELTFIDAEPAKPAHPEFLETEADYQNAPEGTIVACEDSPPWHKFDSAWLSTITHGRNDAKDMKIGRASCRERV